MEPENAGPGVRSTQTVGDGSQDVGRASSYNQPDHGRSGDRGLPEESQEEDPRNSENHVDKGVQPARGIDPENVDHHGDQGCRPHANDDGPPPEGVQGKGDGSIGACNQEEDIDVVEPSQDIGDCW